MKKQPKRVIPQSRVGPRFCLYDYEADLTALWKLNQVDVWS
jgi:hypothetical protein